MNRINYRLYFTHKQSVIQIRREFILHSTTLIRKKNMLTKSMLFHIKCHYTPVIRNNSLREKDCPISSELALHGKTESNFVIYISSN